MLRQADNLEMSVLSNLATTENPTPPLIFGKKIKKEQGVFSLFVAQPYTVLKR